MLDIQLAEAKVFYDADGQATEVLISYDTFRRIQALLERLREDPDQGYFWSDEWQDRIQEGEADIQAGRTVQVTGDNIEQALEWLDE
jgi:predicted transcriptional regulator